MGKENLEIEHKTIATTETLECFGERPVTVIACGGHKECCLWKLRCVIACNECFSRESLWKLSLAL